METTKKQGYIGIVAKKMETTIEGLGLYRDIGRDRALFWGLRFRDNGKDNGNYQL